jgi:hypothetical protein
MRLSSFEKAKLAHEKGFAKNESGKEFIDQIVTIGSQRGNQSNLVGFSWSFTKTLSYDLQLSSCSLSKYLSQ